MAQRKLIKNQKLFIDSLKHLVGGVNSPVRSFKYVKEEPIFIQSGKGSKIYDYDGNEYIDYVLSWGVLLLGHAHPAVVEKVKEALNLGFGFGATHKQEIELAKLIKEAIPFIEKIRFVNSGAEAVMTAIRLARGYTKRDKILKFKNSYHGAIDYLLTKGGSGLATLNIASSPGVPEDFIKHTLVGKINNQDLLEKIFERYQSQIAAVIIEPVGGNYGVTNPSLNFLKILRKLTKKYKTLLIFDEIITGFRFNFCSVAQELGIIPDLICLGKIIGGGLPIGAVGGSNKTMNQLAPLGKVYQASTFSGNPIVMQAGVTTLENLKKYKKNYARIRSLTECLTKNIKKEAKSFRINLKVNSYGSMFSLKFDKKIQFEIFYKSMLKQGIYFAPSEFETNFLSFSHNKENITKTIEAVKIAFKKMRHLALNGIAQVLSF
ncbi:MAG: glutamate-1-semialdehyde 2,1-aminomutase [Candidatus Omnitrophota bacterium]